MSSSKLSPFIIPSKDKRKTFDEDNKLPDLPVPDLDHTLNRYLDSIRPFVNDIDYCRTKEIVKSFEQGVGRILHEKLKKKALTERNWIGKWWDDVVYLQVRLPLLLSCNMNGVLPKDALPWTYGTENDQIKHASLFTYYLLELWMLLRREKLMPVQTADKKTTFSMVQYRKVFNTVRIPGNEIDSLVSYFKTAAEGPCPTNLVIICKGRLFSVNAVDKEENIVTPESWEECLKKILSRCYESIEDRSIAILTSDLRSNWSKNRKRLEKISQRNQNTLSLIDRSLFVLVLDDDLPETDSDVLNTNIHGNLGNRWIDKSMNMIFYKNGRSGSLTDHTAFDGMIPIACINYAVTAVQESTSESRTDSGPRGKANVPEFEELKFDIDEHLTNEIDRLELESLKYMKDILMTKETFDDYGKLEIQNLKFHPDSYVQMCLQLAYVSLHGKPAPCYETATTRKFYNGRTETVRSCTTECLEWVASMLDKKANNETRRTLLEKALKRHDDLMKEAKENKGCDRHLFGLYCVAQQEDIKIPDLFLDPSFFKSGGGGNFILSTSCIGYTPLGGGVPPMCQNGYGIFYNILPHSIHFIISVNIKSTETNASKYFDSIKTSFRRMREILLLTSKL